MKTKKPIKTVVRFTTIDGGELGETKSKGFANFEEAMAFVDGLTGCVGCLKQGDKIKRVF